MVKTNLKILFVLPEYYPHSGGGISTYYIHFLKHLASICKEIKVIVGSGYTQNDNIFEIDHIKVEYLKPNIYKRYLEKFKNYDVIPDYRKNLAAAWAMWDQSNAGEGYDIIECTDFGLGYVPWVINHQKPIVTRLHGSHGQIELNEPHLQEEFMGNYYRLTELTLLSKVDHLVTYSKKNQLFWQNLMPNKKIELINPVYVSSIDRPVAFQNKEKFGMVSGRIQQWKGPEVLCQSLQQLITRPSIRWYGLDKRYNATVTQSKMLVNTYPEVWGKVIQICSPVKHLELQQIQKVALFGIVPSTWDMFNFSCLEYMGNGTPVICSENAGVSSLIINGINGFVYPNNNPSALAGYIKKVISLSESEYIAMANAAVGTLFEKLSPAVTIPLNINLYKIAIEKELLSTANSFMEKTFIPTESSYSIFTILDQQPLKKIINYLIKRIRNK